MARHSRLHLLEVQLEFLGFKKFEPIKIRLDLCVNSLSTSGTKKFRKCSCLLACEHDSTTEMNAHDDA